MPILVISSGAPPDAEGGRRFDGDRRNGSSGAPPEADTGRDWRDTMARHRFSSETFQYIPAQSQRTCYSNKAAAGTRCQKTLKLEDRGQFGC